MSGEFRVRDGVLAGYYLFFLTLNVCLPQIIAEIRVLLVFAIAGIYSEIYVLLVQTSGIDEVRFNPFCSGAFVALMASLIAVDLWIGIANS